MRRSSSAKAGLWLTAAVAVARKQQDRLSEGRLLLLLNRWWSVGHAEYVMGSVFARACVQALDEVGDPEEAHRAISRAMAAPTKAEWGRAREELEQALALLTTSDRTTRTVHAAALVSLAVLRRCEGDRSPVAGVGEATAFLLATVADDPLDRVLLEGLGYYLKAPGRGGHALRPGRGDLHRAILEVPTRTASRRMLELGQIAFALGFPGYARVGPQPDGVPLGVCMTELVVGTPVEVELGRLVMMLYPFPYLLELIDLHTLELATGFLRSTCAPEHPMLCMLESLVARGLDPTAPP